MGEAGDGEVDGGVVLGDTEGPPMCLAWVYHQLLALQWHIRGKA